MAALDFPSAPATGQVYLSWVYDGVKWGTSQFGSGGVAGPSSSTDNAVVRFDGTGGNVVQSCTTFLFTDAGVATLTGTWGLTGTTLATGTFGVVGTSLFTSTLFGVVGTSTLTGTYNVIGTSAFTGGNFNVNGTTQFTSTLFNVAGTTTFTAAQFGVIGTATFTANAFNVVGTTNFTGGAFNATAVGINFNGTTTFTAARFGVIGTALFTANLFSVVGTSQFTGVTNIAGTTNITGFLTNVGTAQFTGGSFLVNGSALFTSGTFGIVGTTLVTGIVGIVGSSILTGTLTVSGTTVLTSVGTGVLIANAGIVTSAGGLVLLATLSPNNVASTNNTSVFTSAYRTYEITFDNICPATQTTTFQMTVSTTGNAYVSGGYISVAMCNVSSVIVTDTSTSVLLLSGVRATTQLLTSTLQGLSGSIKLFNPAATTYNKHIVGATSFATPGAIATTTLAQVQVNGQFNLSTALNGVNFAFSSGNIQTGVIKIYGMT